MFDYVSMNYSSSFLRNNYNIDNDAGMRGTFELFASWT